MQQPDSSLAQPAYRSARVIFAAGRLTPSKPIWRGENDTFDARVRLTESSGARRHQLRRIMRFTKMKSSSGFVPYPVRSMTSFASMQLLRRTDFLWEIPRTGSMRVPGRIYANSRMMGEMRDDPALAQVVNVAC